MGDFQRLILASGSRARKDMLTAAGLNFDVIPADIDEGAITAELLSDGADVEAADIAGKLATEKALAIARANPNAIVVGSDQVLALGRRTFSKAADLAGARATLTELRGRTHELVSAVALATGNELLWRMVDFAELKMRNFSDAFLEDYLDRNGHRILSCVGCYEIEGAGIQLFDRVNGDHFTIMGMPLLPVLNELRDRGVVAA